MNTPGYAPARSRTRRRVLGRGAALLPGLCVLVVLRLACLLAWPVAALGVLVTARAPRWWRTLAGRTLRRAVRQRAHAWLLSDTRSGAHEPHPVLVVVPGTPGLPRRSLLWRLLTSPVYALLRWVLGVFAAVLALAAAVSELAVGRHPRRLQRTQYRLLALCGDIDAYLLLLVPARPRLPEVDPRLAPGGVPFVDHPPLPPWTRRTGRLAIGVDLFCGVFVVGAAAGALAAAGADIEEDLGAILALDLLIQTLAPLMGFYLVASETPLTVTQLGLHVLRPLRSLGLACGLIGSYAILLLALALLAAPLAVDRGGGIVPDDAGVAWTLVFVALATVVAPVFEETFYRGIMFQALRAGRGTWTAAVVSSVAFACAHLEFNPLALADRALIGVGLCSLFARTGRLLPGMFAHSINNAVVLPLGLGWTWQVPLVVLLSLLGVLALATLASRFRGAWDPVGLLRVPAPTAATAAREAERRGAVP
ncbi:MAG: family intrarane metalloprotease [Solirubrobacterales bacterium]|nr:family intrarane metalloprotease [Solirubrobacterales bacterium]